MASSSNNNWIDTSVLPADILSLRDDGFFEVVERLVGKTVVDLIRIQAIDNVRVFMLVPDILQVLHLQSSELDPIKKRVTFLLYNQNFVVKCGIKTSIKYLRDLFEAKLNEYHNNEQDNDIDNEDNISISSDNNVPIGQKRSASLLSSGKTTTTKRRRQ
ncbi:unnamed protein product [Adineta steineri]|uniref:Uncharacterized protein n=1 Tax=Adineta steineri TaxID=433720 RepID=A0A815JFU4_9BILA|nr:unnamed protein product [Adineta steineri]CAF1376863.1 unnamed protein product [Adineta steineri]CAF1378811.1 unnamed protein product [Adineta steineri]